MAMTYDKRNRDNLAKLADNTRVAAMKWYDYLVKNNLDVLIYETIRSVETQRENVRKGASQTMQSYHIVGQALDFVMVKNGVALWSGYNSADAKKVVAEAKRLGFEWGGDWKSFYDAPHLQFNYKGYGSDTFGKYAELTKPKPKPVAKPAAKPAPAKPAAAKESGVVTSDVWIHSKDTSTFAASTRVKVLKKGEKVSIFEEGKHTYKIGKGMYVSKPFIVKVVAPKAKTGYVVADVWLHSKPDVARATRTVVMKKGSKLGIYDTVSGMYKVRVGGKTHYVSKSYVTVN